MSRYLVVAASITILVLTGCGRGPEGPQGPLEAEILKEALEHATGSKKRLRLPPSPPKDGSR